MTPQRLSFSGHETFHCRSLWLKKGYDFLKEGNLFTDETSIGQLGVGKNMVSSIRFWLRAFGFTDENDKVIEDGPAKLLFTRQCDPYLEDHTSLWLLHYYLVKTGKASIYDLIFNHFRKERVEFTKEHIYRFLKLHCEESGTLFNENTIKNDINVFIKNYHRPVNTTKNIEDEFSGILIDLNLIKLVQIDESNVIPRYSIISSERGDLPWQLILFCILDDSGELMISFNDLMTKPNGVGLVFALSADCLMKKINEIVDNYHKTIHFTNDNGIREIQFLRRPNKWDVLGKYYGRI